MAIQLQPNIIWSPQLLQPGVNRSSLRCTRAIFYCRANIVSQAAISIVTCLYSETCNFLRSNNSLHYHSAKNIPSQTTALENLYGASCAC